MDMEKQSITMEELKKQVEVLGSEEKQKTKFLIEEWKRLCEEKRLEAEQEEKRLEVDISIDFFLKKANSSGCEFL